MTEKTRNPSVAVIGGGPAGLLAAGTAAASGADVQLFEKMQDCGRKLLVTGSGQCNITNSAPFGLFLDQFPDNHKFLYPAFRSFFVDDLKALLGQYQLSLVLDDNGKYFPETRQAQSVLDVLLTFCKNQQVDFHCNEPVRRIEQDNGGWVLQTKRRTCQVDCVILATGGLSYPGTGSDGDGHRMAKQLEQAIVPTRPALVPLKISGFNCASLSGISLRGIRIILKKNHQKIASQNGDLLFTHFGVSGPPVLFLSRWLPSGFDQNPDHPDFSLSINLLPEIRQDDLARKLLGVFADSPNRQLKTALSKDFELPQQFAAALVRRCGFEADIRCQAITRVFRQKLLFHLKAFDLSISGTCGYNKAMVTAGGISTKQINPRTMESEQSPGLFFAGEIIDIDGFTGGYNLQAAFSTGYLAGKSAAKRGGTV